MKQMLKRNFLFFALLSVAMYVSAQSYGIMVNGTTFHKATALGNQDFQGRDQYLVSVQLEEGDYLTLYDNTNKVAFMTPMESGATSAKGNFTETADKATCNVAGCYDFYIKLKMNDNSIWCQTGSNCSGGQGGTDGDTPCFGILINGGDYIPATLNNEYAGVGMEYMLLQQTLTAGTEFQIYDKCSEAGWVEPIDPASTFSITKGESWYLVAETNVYDIYIKMMGYGNNQIYIGCNSCKDLSSVPSQSTAVMMQGFFYDSYDVNDTIGNGTETYGDTKWRTLLPQAGEIGAYFDMIWLPPSGYAAGVGYHPKQYSNQNSDWGSRAELESLIKAFHNSGTKVIADIVINHTEAMATWCDFAVQNFGEYGVFEPDGSYICSNDEINHPANKSEELAGDCWGTATGPEDDGANWDAARDWAHQSPKVQAMFKAYLQWMRNVMGFDGWRYDKGDGFNNAHMDTYNRASTPDIAFMECWSGNDEIKNRIGMAGNNVMALDFQTKYSAIDAIAGWNYSGRGAGLMADDYWKKYAVTWVDNHDMFLRGNGQEFGGNGNSMTDALKYRLLDANALILSMPGVPCLFYPHWYKYKNYLKDMINARHCAGIHSESEVKDESWSANNTGYQATVVGKNGYLILCLGDKTGQQHSGCVLMASGYHTYDDNGNKHNESYEMWVHADSDVAPGLIVTPDASFEDKEVGVQVTMQAVGGTGAGVIYYTLDGTEPTTESLVYTEPLTITETTTVKVMAVCGTAQSQVQTYTYTYREPLKRGIRVRFNKPAQWEKVYYYAWIPGVDEEGNATSENIMGAYPGQRIYPDLDGWYSYEFDQSLQNVHFCISSGEDCGGLNIRSNDLEVDYDADFGWTEGFETESQYEVQYEQASELNPDFDLNLSPETSSFRDQEEGIIVTINAIGRHGTIIYYSTDGSDPALCANPAQDSVTLTLHETATVQAYAFDAATKEQTDTYTNTYTYKAPQDGPITVRFVKPQEWEQVYLYAFTRVKVGNKYKDTPYALDGKTTKWPGMLWTQTEVINDVEWHTWTMKEDVKEIFVIFTEGNRKPQTQDIFLTENTCYVWRAECRRAVVDDTCDGVDDGTGIKELDAMQNVQQYNKVIVNDHLYILHEGKVYDIFGQQVK